MLCPLNIKNCFFFLTAWSENDKSMSMRKARKQMLAYERI